MSSEHDTQAGTCRQPIDAAVLADYWLGLLDDEAVELHLLSCDACGARLRELIALVEGVRQIAREGDLQLVVSDTFLRRAAEQGLRVREYAPPAGGSVQCTVTADDDLLVGRLSADLSGATRVDLSFCDERGVEQGRLSDIPVHDGTRSVAFQESISVMKALPSTTMIARLVAFDAGGGERVVGEYTFHHTRTLPGPGGPDTGAHLR